MTRINLIPPADLCDLHLGAEYHELPRIFTLARDGANVPPAYCLGKGHMTFFYNKLKRLFERQCALVDEMRARGRTVNYDPLELYHKWRHTKAWGWNDWVPTDKEIALNLARVDKRRDGMGLPPTYLDVPDHRATMLHQMAQVQRGDPSV
jgi:hypothetical protein